MLIVYKSSTIGGADKRLDEKIRQQEQPHIMENIIYNELVMRGFNVDVGIIEHIVRDETGKRQTKT